MVGLVGVVGLGKLAQNPGGHSGEFGPLGHMAPPGLLSGDVGGSNISG